MACKRYIIVCEGESERAYLQRLQSFLDKHPEEGEFDPPLRFVAPERAIAKGGLFSMLRNHYNRFRKENRNAAIEIWADFDLYHRNDNHCADSYRAKTQGIPDFRFSFHNFEDFFALHSSGEQFQAWLEFGNLGHFDTPLHSDGYMPAIEGIFPDYKKGSLPAEFVTWDSLRNLKQNKAHRPTSNPHNLQGIRCFADFLISEIESAFPGRLS